MGAFLLKKIVGFGTSTLRKEMLSLRLSLYVKLYIPMLIHVKIEKSRSASHVGHLSSYDKQDVS
jgi:hypothetical protein